MTSTQLTEANLTRASLIDASLSGANLSGTDVAEDQCRQAETDDGATSAEPLSTAASTPTPQPVPQK